MGDMLVEAAINKDVAVIVKAGVALGITQAIAYTVTGAIMLAVGTIGNTAMEKAKPIHKEMVKHDIKKKLKKH